VIDPFLGSGSTLIAAQETGRTVVGVELDPRYVAIAIKRWQTLTGKDAINAATGETFDAYVDRIETADKVWSAAVKAKLEDGSIGTGEAI
jgi:DNA modification methylase